MNPRLESPAPRSTASIAGDGPQGLATVLALADTALAPIDLVYFNRPTRRWQVVLSMSAEPGQDQLGANQSPSP